MENFLDGLVALVRAEIIAVVRAEVKRALGERRRRPRKPAYVKKTGPRETNWENELRKRATASRTKDASALIMGEIARVGGITALQARALVGRRNITVRALTSLLESGAVRRVAGVYSLAPEGAPSEGAPSAPIAAQHPE